MCLQEVIILLMILVLCMENKVIMKKKFVTQEISLQCLILLAEN